MVPADKWFGMSDYRKVSEIQLFSESSYNWFIAFVELLRQNAVLVCTNSINGLFATIFLWEIALDKATHT